MVQILAQLGAILGNLLTDTNAVFFAISACLMEVKTSFFIVAQMFAFMCVATVRGFDPVAWPTAVVSAGLARAVRSESVIHAVSRRETPVFPRRGVFMSHILLLVIFP